MNATRFDSEENLDREQKDHSETIQLLDIYLTEWVHRDLLLWQQVYRYFYAILIVMLLPNIAPYLQIDVPPLIPKMFPALGIIMSIIFFYVALGYSKRLDAIGITYQNLINTLPPHMQRIRLKKVPHGKYFTVKLAYLIPSFLFTALMIIGITMLTIY